MKKYRFRVRLTMEWDDWAELDGEFEDEADLEDELRRVIAERSCYMEDEIEIDDIREDGGDG